ncbi:MAG TPA: hypothetical protein VHY08_04355, partial [Bacillota bacterium]|nr:hypothetical protein [Bacillota bacterium]
MQFISTWKKIITNKIFWLLLLFIGINLVYVNQFSLVLKDTVLINAEGDRRVITLPYLQEMPVSEYVIAGKIRYDGLISPRLVQIIPDDTVLSLRVNGREVLLNEVNPAYLSDRVKGFHFNLGRYLHKGDNDLEIRIANGGGPSGLLFQTSPLNIGHLILLILIMAMAYLILSHFIPNKVWILILLAGFLIRITYFWVTPYNLRECDVDGHIQYIRYITDNGSLPGRHYGWETYQPPFYYITAALVYKAADFLGVQGAYYLYRALQLYSLLLFMGFLLAALLIFQFICSRLSSFQNHTKLSDATAESPPTKINDWFISLMLGVLTFWPTAIVHSIRVGNDVMFYFLYSWGLYFLMKWYYESKNRYFYISFGLTTLGFITKSNAAVLYGLIGIVYLVKIWQERKIKRY